MHKIDDVMQQLIEGKTLNEKHADHRLQGELAKYRECHIEGDWLLLYKIEDNDYGMEIITFCATDNHANLFK